MPWISPNEWIGEELLKHTIAFVRPDWSSYKKGGIFCVSKFYNDYEGDPVIQIVDAKDPSSLTSREKKRNALSW